jgi:hypothetical protein
MGYEKEYKAKYYLLGHEKDGKMVGSPVFFVKDQRGNWKISQFYEYIRQNNLGE